MRSIIIFLWLLLPVTLILSKDGQEIQLLIKKSELKDGKISFKRTLPGEVDFLRFLTSSQVVIDRTHLIHYILENFIQDNLNYAITAPSRWGKSTFVTMLEFFFNPQLDERFHLIEDQSTTNAYKFFKHGKVLIEGQMQEFDKTPLLYKNRDEEEQQLINNNLGQHPVLLISFYSLYSIGRTLANVENHFRIILRRAIEKYEPIIRKVCNQKKKVNEIEIKDDIQIHLCNEYVSYFVKMEHSDWIINTLVKLLYIYFEKNVIVIIDEFHTLPNRIYMNYQSISEEERVKMLAFYLGILAPITKNDVKEKYFTLFTGIIPITFPGFSGISVQYHTFMEKEIVTHFGIFDEIGDEIMGLANYNETLKKQMKEEFNHYNHPDYPGASFMNPFSLLSKVHHTKQRFPWSSENKLTGFIQMITRKNLKAWSTLLNLLQDKCLDFNVQPGYLNNPISIDSVHNIDINLWDESNSMIFQEHFLNYLLHTGCLTITTRKAHEEVNMKRHLKKPEQFKTEESELDNICVGIPNAEIRFSLWNLLGTPDVSKLVILLSKILFDHTIPLSKFVECYQGYIRSPPSYLIHGSEMFYHAQLYFLIIEELHKLYDYKSLMDYRMLSESRITPDIMLHNETCGAIIEMKYNQVEKKIDEAYELQLCNYGRIFHKAYPGVTKVRYILLNVIDKSGTIEITNKEYIISSEVDFLKFEIDCKNNEEKYNKSSTTTEP